MFQKSLLEATSKKNKKKKFVKPKLKVETMADIYTLFVLVRGIPAEDFWNLDIRFLDFVYMNKIAWDSYVKNPKER